LELKREESNPVSQKESRGIVAKGHYLWGRPWGIGLGSLAK